MNLAEKIRDIVDFPKPGVVFRDITTLIKDPEGFKFALESLYEKYKDVRVDLIVGVESRGFIFGAPLAYMLNAGFVPVRKVGKLPCETIKAEYALEYGTSAVEIHTDSIQPGQRVLIVDDLLATGGTAAATVQLVEQVGGKVIGTAFVIELTFLKGRNLLSEHEVFTLVQYNAE
jgi:adenine phosphoribosyltransferase